MKSKFLQKFSHMRKKPPHYCLPIIMAAILKKCKRGGVEICYTFGTEDSNICQLSMSLKCYFKEKQWQKGSIENENCLVCFWLREQQ